MTAKANQKCYPVLKPYYDAMENKYQWCIAAVPGAAWAKKMFHGMGTGIRLTLSYNELKNQFIPKPSIKEQEAIATYLDEKCAAIEQSIADKQTQIETLKAYKASLIYEYVTGKKQVAL